nr:KTSC domain-containing protein [Gammaproteobacteria bacterium]
MPADKSKAIRRIAYDAEAQTLDVEFSSSKVYRYFDVPPTVYAWLERVRSKGRFVNRLIKDKYRFERVDEPSANGDVPTLLEALRKSLEPPPDED